MFRLRDGVRLGEDIRGWGATELIEGFSSGVNKGWIEIKVPGVSAVGRRYFSHPKDETQEWG